MHYKQQAERDGYMFILSGIHTTARRSILQQSVMHALDVDRSFLTLKVLLYSSVLILLAASISFTPADVFFFVRLTVVRIFIVAVAPSELNCSYYINDISSISSYVG